MSSAPHAVQNALLAALPPGERNRLMGLIRPVSLSLGDILYEPGQPITKVYFPVSALISLLALVEAQSALEVGMIGREGMLGVPLILGVKRSPVRALVQGGGLAFAMPSEVFLREMEGGGALRSKVLGFTHELMLQISQSAACNRFHPVTARLARWLLMTRDRVGANEFPLTHKFLADMLGVRRAGITDAASGLQRRKMIEYTRGNIRILDARSLENVACTCYQVGRGIYSKKRR